MAGGSKFRARRRQILGDLRAAKGLFPANLEDSFWMRRSARRLPWKKPVQLESATYCAVRYPCMSSVRVQADVTFATPTMAVADENKMPDGYT